MVKNHSFIGERAVATNRRITNDLDPFKGREEVLLDNSGGKPIRVGSIIEVTIAGERKQYKGRIFIENFSMRVVRKKAAASFKLKA